MRHIVWPLSQVPFFRGMHYSDGSVCVEPVEREFLARVAVNLRTDVFAPLERPPVGLQIRTKVRAPAARSALPRAVRH